MSTLSDDVMMNSSAVLIQVVLTTEGPVAAILRAFECTWGDVLGLDMAIKSLFLAEWAGFLTSTPRTN